MQTKGVKQTKEEIGLKRIHKMEHIRMEKEVMYPSIRDIIYGNWFIYLSLCKAIRFCLCPLDTFTASSARIDMRGVHMWLILV